MKITISTKVSSILFFFVSLVSFNSSAAQEPSIATISISATSGACNEINLSFFPGDGSRRLVIASAGSPVSRFPSDGTSYTGGSIYGTGTNLGAGNYVVYNGTGTSATISGLDGGTDYYFASFEFNGVGANSNYLITGYPEDHDIAPGISMSVLASSGDICQGDSVQLQASGALTYSWSPSAGLSSPTDPIVTAVPVSTTTYTVTGTDAGGCQDSKTLTVVVNSLPLVTLASFQPICENQGEINLTGGNPVGGMYFGDGISSGTLDPTIPGPGNVEIFYTYTNIHGCKDTASRIIQIKSAPNVSLTTLNGVCINASSFAMSGGTPAGGDYYGAGINVNNIFNAANAGVGTHSVTYIYSSQGCSDTAMGSLSVFALPNVLFANLSSVCLNTPTYQLTGGTPVGGTYSGTSVSGNQFSPAAAGIGTYIITYNYTDVNGCASSDTSQVRVNGIPTVTFSTLPTVCQNTGPVALNQGSPAGGTYSGTGVGGTTFFTGIAGAGTHVLTYTYRDGNNCSNSATQNIVVNAIPSINLGPDETICAGSSTVLNGGTFSTYAWSTGANTPSITVDSTGRGFGTFRFILIATNTFTCANRDTIFITIDPCNGVNEANMLSYDLYPNPFSSNLVVKMKSLFSVSIFDVTGRLVFEQEKLFSEAEFGEQLLPGIYFLRVKTADGSSTTKIIKQ